MAASTLCPGAAQVQQVCVLVRERSARLIAATLAGILRHLHRNRCAPGLPPPV